MNKPKLIDLFCGAGGWTEAFQAEGWECTGVDVEDKGYAGRLLKTDVRNIKPGMIESFDAVCASPPCEEFARACLPWLRGDKQPSEEALSLLTWSVGICKGKKRRITESSLFSTRYLPGAAIVGSYALWGDVPALLPYTLRGKSRLSGRNPVLRAKIRPELSRWIAKCFTRSFVEGGF